MARRGGIGTVTPVRGLRPTFALRILTCRLPMPARTTFSPDRSDSCIARRVASTAEVASLRVLSTRPTTRIKLDLFTLLRSFCRRQLAPFRRDFTLHQVMKRAQRVLAFVKDPVDLRYQRAIQLHPPGEVIGRRRRFMPLRHHRHL